MKVDLKYNISANNHRARTSEGRPCQVAHRELLPHYWQTQDVESDHWNNAPTVSQILRKYTFNAVCFRWILLIQVTKPLEPSALWNTNRIKISFPNWNSAPLFSRHLYSWKIFCFWQTVKWKMMFPTPPLRVRLQIKTSEERSKIIVGFPRVVLTINNSQ